MPVNEATRKVIADGIEVYKTTEGVRVLKIPMRCMPDRCEEYVPPGDHRWLVVDSTFQKRVIDDLREVRKWNGKEYEPLNLDELLPRLIRTRQDTQGQFIYEVVDNWYTNAIVGTDKASFDREHRCKDVPNLGSLVYPQFTRKKHVVPASMFPYNPNEPILRGWDCGHVTPAVVWAQIDRECGRLIVYHTHYEKRMGASEFATIVNGLSSAYFPMCRQFKDFGDPAGSVDAGTGTWWAELAAHDIHVFSTHSRGVKPEERVSRYRTLLTQTHQDIPMIVWIDTPDNEIQFQAMERGYHYDSADKIKKNHPDSDVCNCTEYVIIYGMNVPTRTYGGSYQGNKQYDQSRSHIPPNRRRKRSQPSKHYTRIPARGAYG